MLSKPKAAPPIAQCSIKLASPMVGIDKALARPQPIQGSQRTLIAFLTRPSGLDGSCGRPSVGGRLFCQVDTPFRLATLNARETRRRNPSHLGSFVRSKYQRKYLFRGCIHAAIQAPDIG